jgi:hypothetical protein
MAERNLDRRDQPELAPDEEEAPLHPTGGPDAIDAGAWGTYEPLMADLELYLTGVTYPVAKADLVRQVRRNGAPANLVAFLEQLPEHVTIDSAADISRGLD